MHTEAIVAPQLLLIFQSHAKNLHTLFCAEPFRVSSKIRRGEIPNSIRAACISRIQKSVENLKPYSEGRACLLGANCCTLKAHPRKLD